MKKFLGIPAGLGYFGMFAAIYLTMQWDWSTHKSPPDQPIAFSHKIHVTTVGLECTFCHDMADKSMFAGIPPVEKCMSCHKNVKTDRPEIQKLAGYWEREEPMEWNRVHRIRIRNHVFFSHKRHVKKDITCQQCHGLVEYMDQVRRVSSLEMGWCVGCHQENDASTDCLTCHQ